MHETTDSPTKPAYSRQHTQIAQQLADLLEVEESDLLDLIVTNRQEVADILANGALAQRKVKKRQTTSLDIQPLAPLRSVFASGEGSEDQNGENAAQIEDGSEKTADPDEDDDENTDEESENDDKTDKDAKTPKKPAAKKVAGKAKVKKSHPVLKKNAKTSFGRSLYR